MLGSTTATARNTTTTQATTR
ncbi:unnamed protein product, partial [Rotaria magnacalcarata]